jgi:hypothetical protein
VREIGLGQPARLMDLGEHDLAGRTLQSSPGLDSSLKGA